MAHISLTRACALALLLGCSPSGRAPEAHQSTPNGGAQQLSQGDRRDLARIEVQPKWAASEHLLTYKGSSFQFLYPAEASIETGTASPSQISGALVRGPDFFVRGMWPGSVDPVSRQGPAYALVVATLPNPQRLTLNQFADSVLRQYNARVTLDGAIGAARLDSAQFGGQPARIITPYCGDCFPYEVYFVRGDQVVVFAFSFADDDLLSNLSWPLYWLMISSFHWTT